MAPRKLPKGSTVPRGSTPASKNQQHVQHGSGDKMTGQGQHAQACPPTSGGIKKNPFGKK